MNKIIKIAISYLSLRTLLFTHYKLRRFITRRIHRVVFVGLAALTLASCLGGGGGGGSSDLPSSSIASITIQSSNVTVDESGMAVARLSGEAFVSPNFVAFRCAGLACIFGLYDDADPGVDVFWKNLTTGTQGRAGSRYGTLTDFAHKWSATVPLVVGVNNLQVRAADPAGNAATNSVKVNYNPPAPDDLRANTSNGEITLIWSPIPEATAYRVYWATTSGDVFPFGTTIDVTGPPYVHSGLANGTTYYYVITSLFRERESPPSNEIAATAGVPPQPMNLAAAVVGPDVQLTWDAVTTADTYTLYWANEPGVTKQSGAPIVSAISPYIHTGLSGVPYYYVVTAINGLGESLESEEVMALPKLAPPSPTMLSAVQRKDLFGNNLQAVDLKWQSIPGIYDVYRCQAFVNSSPNIGCQASPRCFSTWERIASNIKDTFYVDYAVELVGYLYYATNENTYGVSMPSDSAGLCVLPP